MSKLLRGHQGKSYLDSGVVHAPYIPLQFTDMPDEPSAVDRLAGTIDPEAKKRCDEIDAMRQRIKESREFKITTFDFVADPSLPSDVPSLTGQSSSTPKP